MEKVTLASYTFLLQ